jgi:hypothetical protein
MTKYAVDEHALLQTNDPGVWARTFMRVVTADDAPMIDESFMISWFANAMEAQRLAMEIDRCHICGHPKNQPGNLYCSASHTDPKTGQRYKVAYIS